MQGIDEVRWFEVDGLKFISKLKRVSIHFLMISLSLPRFVPLFRFSVLLSALGLAGGSLSAAESGGTVSASKVPQWIWSADTPNASQAADEGSVYFRRIFELPADHSVETAIMNVGVDNQAEIFLNGNPVGTAAGWNPLTRLQVASALQPGQNVLTVRGTNSAPGPAGLLLDLKVTLKDVAKPVLVVTDAAWVATKDEGVDWKDGKGEKPWPAAAVVAQNGGLPWGLCLSQDAIGSQEFPKFSAEGGDVSVLGEMLKRFHAACNMDVAGTYSLAWLPRAMLWVGEANPVTSSSTRARIANRIGSMHISPEGYVSCHQHEGLAHSEGWPFPFPEQSHGFSFYFTMLGLPFGPEFGLPLKKDVDGWKLQGAKTEVLDAARGWSLDLTEPDAVITSPAFDVDALVSPFIRVKWDATGLPHGSKPWVEWTTETEKEFSAERRMEFPAPSTSSRPPIEDFDIPVQKLTGAKGRLTGLRIGFGNPSPGKVTLQRVFSSVDSRHVINNPNYLIAATDFFNWTGDTDWLLKNLPHMRLALAYMIREFSVRETGLLRRPWVGQDGRSGLEITASGEKVIHDGLGIGGNYWDLLPFGGDDVVSTIYLYTALRQMADLESFVAKSLADEAAKPAADLKAASLYELADQVRTTFQKTFWNAKTGRFAPLDDRHEFRDYGFTFVNNEAMFYGLATDAQAKEILTWLDGKRTVEGDTATGADIYHFRFGPRSSTKRNIDYYQYVWSRPEDLKFGDQVQDGGAVLGFEYHDLMDRIRYQGPDSAWKRLQEMFAWYRDVEAEGGARAYYAVPGRGTLQGGGTAGGLGIDEEFYESVLVPSVVLDGFLGFAVRPDGFDLNPRLPEGVTSLGLSSIAYRDLLWNVKFSADTITFEVESGEVDRPLQVHLPAGAWTAVVRRPEGKEEQIPIPDGTVGFELPAGPLSSLILKKSKP